MNRWEWYCLGAFLNLLACGLLVFFARKILNRVIGLQFAAAIQTNFLLAFAIATGRPEFLDLALTTALLGFGAGLLFVRFIERWEQP